MHIAWIENLNKCEFILKYHVTASISVLVGNEYISNH